MSSRRDGRTGPNLTTPHWLNEISASSPARLDRRWDFLDRYIWSLPLRCSVVCTLDVWYQWLFAWWKSWQIYFRCRPTLDGFTLTNIFFSIKALTVFTSLTLGNRYRKHTNSSSSATSSSSTSQITQLGKSLLISWSLFKLLQGSFLTLSLEGAVTILACKAVDVGLSICQVVIGSIWAPGLEQYHWSWTTSGSFHYRYQIRWSVVSIYVHNAARWKIYHCLGCTYPIKPTSYRAWLDSMQGFHWASVVRRTGPAILPWKHLGWSHRCHVWWRR